MPFEFQGKSFHVSPKRWGVLLLCCWMLFMDMLSFCFFSFINDIASWYFHTTPALTDLLASSHLIGRIFGGVAICLTGWAGLRDIAVCGSTLNAVASILISVGVFLNTFAIVIAGAFVNGVSSGTLLTMTQLITVTWFPPEETGKATSAPWAARRVSLLVSNLISTKAMDTSIFSNPMGISTPYRPNGDNSELRSTFERTYLVVFGVFGVISLLCTVISRIYITDTPPVFETKDEYADDVTDENTSLLGLRKSVCLQKECRDLINVFRNPSLILLFVMTALVASDATLGFVLISSIVETEFRQENDQSVGIVSAAGILIGSLGSVVAGQILDKVGKPRITFICLATLLSVCLASFSVSLGLRNLPGVYTTYLLMSVPRDALLVCIIHLIASVVSDQSHSVQMKVFSIGTMSGAISIAVSTIVIRAVMTHASTPLAVLFPLPFLVLSVVCYIYLWPTLQKGLRA